MFRTLALFGAAALMAGCAAQVNPKPFCYDNPANPRAPEAPVASSPAPLALEPPPAAAVSDAGSPEPSADSPMQHMDMKGMDMKGMDMANMAGMDHGQKPAATQPGQAASATEGMHHRSHPSSATRPTTAQAIYTCKMHPQVVSDHPGKCPICGMKLVVKEGMK